MAIKKKKAAKSKAAKKPARKATRKTKAKTTRKVAPKAKKTKKKVAKKRPVAKKGRRKAAPTKARTLIVLFNLRRGIKPAAYERWAQKTDVPIAGGLKSVKDFKVFAAVPLLRNSPRYGARCAGWRYRQGAADAEGRGRFPEVCRQPDLHRDREVRRLARDV